VALFGYSGGKTAQIGAGTASSGGNLAKMYEFASPETAAMGSRLINPYWGRATVLNGGTTVAVIFDEPRSTADYLVFVSLDEAPGAVAEAPWPTAKTVNGFTINVDADPTQDVDMSWLAVG
jgi:hypothetical protein